MFNHAPNGYDCPICVAVQGIESDNTLIRKSDILFKNNVVMVFIASFFITGSEGHLIVVPVKHFEHIYDLPDEIGNQISATVRRFSLEMKQKYACDGLNIVQNNEPAAGQHAFHYHVHLFPRYNGVDLWSQMGTKRLATQAERATFAAKFRS